MQIDLPESLLSRIKKDAVPYVDTYIYVLERL